MSENRDLEARGAREWHTLLIAALLVIGQVGAASSYAGDVSAELSDAGLARLERHFQEKIEAGQRSGYVLAVAMRGQPTHLSVLGLRDREHGLPMTMKTRFRLASLSKPVTTVAVLMLVEEGRLLLSDPVDRYLPEFSDMQVAVARGEDGQLAVEPARRPITVFDLLAHRSGMVYRGHENSPAREVWEELSNAFYAPGTLEDKVSVFARLPLYFHPGEAWGYGPGTDVLGRVIEVVTGEPFVDFMDRRVFEPLGMEDTAFGGVGASGERLAVAYSHDVDGALVAMAAHPLDNLTWPSGAGGMVSTAADYLRFLRMLASGGVLDGVRLLSPRSVDIMTSDGLPAVMSPIDLASVPTAGFGLGVGVAVDEPRYPHYLAGGDYFWAGSTDTFFFVSPSTGLIGLYLSQYHPTEYTTEWRGWEEFAVLAHAALVPAAEAAR